MYWIRRFVIFLGLAFCLSFTFWAVPKFLNPVERDPEQKAIDRLWVDSSPYWLDRQACRWLGVCGLHHLRRDPAAIAGDSNGEHDEEWGELKKRSQTWGDGTEAPVWEGRRQRKNIKDRRKVLRDVPEYVLRYAPLVHLYSKEEFWPSDIKEHVEHMTVYVDDEPLNDTEATGWNLNNLHELNKYEGLVVLKSNDDVETRPEWLHSHFNSPNLFEQDPELAVPPTMKDEGRGKFTRPEKSTWYNADKNHPLHRISDPRLRKQPSSGPGPNLRARGHKPDEDGYSKAPAILIVVDKGNGVVDAFWMFFYSYNLGQTVLGIRFGNHVGDWEHCMMRFENGVPKGLYFSEHEGGQAYAWEAVEKYGDRPVIYSAVGSHAMYPLPGDHPYVIPFRLLKDVTDKGPLWDPALNNYAYHYDYTLEDPVNDIPSDPDGVADPTDANPLISPLKLEEEDPRKNAHYNPYSLVPAASNPKAPVSWFHFRGRWGDEVYTLADPRQWRFFGQYHYVTGPDGPKFKNLDRTMICQTPHKCQLSYELDPSGTWY